MRNLLIKMFHFTKCICDAYSKTYIFSLHLETLNKTMCFLTKREILTGTAKVELCFLPKQMPPLFMSNMIILKSKLINISLNKNVPESA